MKYITLALLGGLCFTAPALAANPAPQQDAATAGSSMKIGIDTQTGKRRALTAEESAALDAAPVARTRARTLSTPLSKARLPATEAEALRTLRTANGISIMKPSAETLSSLTVTRNADGTLTYAENGEALGIREAASE